ncbi:MAG: PE domain-containing protein [Magnetococcales bacterium]|nr:PE domain-containing protein [Magnetococcales bacterium]
MAAATQTISGRVAAATQTISGGVAAATQKIPGRVAAAAQEISGRVAAATPSHGTHHAGIGRKPQRDRHGRQKHVQKYRPPGRAIG